MKTYRTARKGKPEASHMHLLLQPSSSVAKRECIDQETSRTISLPFATSKTFEPMSDCVKMSGSLRVHMSTSCQKMKPLHRHCVLILCNHSSSIIGPIVNQRGEGVAYASLTLAQATWGRIRGLQVRDLDCGVSHLAAVGVQRK